MKMSGHLTNSIMKRYDIVNLSDQQGAMARREVAREKARSDSLSPTDGPSLPGGETWEQAKVQ